MVRKLKNKKTKKRKYGYFRNPFEEGVYYGRFVNGKFNNKTRAEALAMSGYAKLPPCLSDQVNIYKRERVEEFQRRMQRHWDAARERIRRNGIPYTINHDPMQKYPGHF